MAVLQMDVVGVGPGPPRNATPDPFYIQIYTDDPPTAVAQVRYQNLSDRAHTITIGSPTKGTFTRTVPNNTPLTTINIPTGQRPAIILDSGPWGFHVADWVVSEG